ncbi:MAG: HDOD domain-containing protein [Colwellia sp.]
MSTSIGHRTTEQWIDLIATNELPAITSTAKMLDRFSNDDKSSLPKLSKAILYDQALSSCLLRVANSTQHVSVNKVTTVSRATVVLGISAVKNICLTAKLVESLLQSENLDITVYNQLTQIMANSFFSGMLAKMMVPNYNDDTQEEVYLAAMLYRIGESAFWSAGGDIAKQLVKHIDMSDKHFAQYFHQQTGSSFNQLSKGLATTWNLSDLLLKALDQPTSRTDEIKIIYFADQLSAIIASPGESEEKFEHLLKDIADIMKISVKQLKVRITHTKEQAQQLLVSYGASKLKKLLKPLPKSSDFSKRQLPVHLQMSKEKAILSIFMQLTQLMKTSKDLNEFLQTIVKKSAEAFGFERCSFLMLTDDKTRVKLRFAYDHHGIKEPLKITFNIRQSDNVIERALASSTPALINNYQDKQWRDFITQELEGFIDDGVLALIPVKIADKPIGLISAQFFAEHHEISTEDFHQLCSLTDHLNMCLTMIMLH